MVMVGLKLLALKGTCYNHGRVQKHGCTRDFFFFFWMQLPPEAGSNWNFLKQFQHSLSLVSYTAVHLTLTSADVTVSQAADSPCGIDCTSFIPTQIVNNCHISWVKNILFSAVTIHVYAFYSVTIQSQNYMIKPIRKTVKTLLLKLQRSSSNSCRTSMTTLTWPDVAG